MRSIFVFTFATAALCSLALPGAAAIDPDVEQCIQKVVRYMNNDHRLSVTDDMALQMALRDAAKRNPAVRRGLMFGQTSSVVLAAANARDEDGGAVGILSALLHDKGSKVRVSLNKLGDTYQGNGVLSIVNYHKLVQANSVADLDEINDRGGSDWSDAYFAYVDEREAGLGPQEAFEKLKSVTKTDREAADALGRLRGQLSTIGRIAFTGYNPATVDSDAWHFFEARIAHDTHSNKHTDAAPATFPIDYMSQRIRSALQQDMGHMLLPVHKVVDDTLAEPQKKPEQKTADRTPNWNDLRNAPHPAPASTTPLSIPGFDQIGRPMIKNHYFPRTGSIELQSWGTPDNTAPHSDLEWKWARPAYGIDILKFRQPMADGNLRTMGAYLSLPREKPKALDVDMVVWFWGDKGTAYFAGDSASGSEPAQNLRAYLKAGRGETQRVIVHVKPNAEGKFVLKLYTHGACALAVDDIFESQSAGGNVTTAKK